MAQIRINNITFNTDALDGFVTSEIRDMMQPMTGTLGDYIVRAASSKNLPFSVQPHGKGNKVAIKKNGENFSGSMQLTIAEYNKESWSPNYSYIDLVNLFNYGYTASKHAYSPYIISKGRNGQGLFKRSSTGGYRMPTRLHRDPLYFIQEGIYNFLAANPYIDARYTPNVKSGSSSGRSRGAKGYRSTTLKGKKFDQKQKTNMSWSVAKTRAPYLYQWGQQWLDNKIAKGNTNPFGFVKGYGKKYKPVTSWVTGKNGKPLHDIYGEGIKDFGKHHNEEWFIKNKGGRVSRRRRSEDWYNPNWWRYK